MKFGPLLAALGAALALTFAVGFFSFYFTTYSAPGGASQCSWEFQDWPAYIYRDMASNVDRIEQYKAKVAEAAKNGRTLQQSEIPKVARTETPRLICTAVGMAVMAFFLFLRSRVFWWPHPAGYVLWMNPGTLNDLWFSFFLGWALKTGALKFGGQKIFLSWRKFFLGALVGEALAALFWIAIAAATGLTDGYRVQ
jgi:hypothetical protein